MKLSAHEKVQLCMLVLSAFFCGFALGCLATMP